MSIELIRDTLKNRWIATALFVSLNPTMAGAQWTVEILHPTSALASHATATTETLQAGWFVVSLVSPDAHAALWNGTPASLVDLSPAGSTASRVLAAVGTKQYGYATIGGINRAAAWNGTSASFDDLHPPGTVSSQIAAATETRQGGSAEPTGALNRHAGIWSGSASSFIYLHPLNAGTSTVTAMSGDVQVGSAYIFGPDETHAALWRGSAASFVDLNPSWAHVSRAFAAAGDRQGGYAAPFGTSWTHAVVWSGSASNLVDLHPPNPILSGSQVNAMTESAEVGSVFVSGGIGRSAAIWHGTSSSYINLHSFLPPGYVESEALGIAQNATATFVVGWAVGSFPEAVLWIGPPPVGMCYADCDTTTGVGVLDIFDFLCFQNSFVNAEPYACDCDTTTGPLVCDLFDFLCFQNAFVSGCQ